MSISISDSKRFAIHECVFRNDIDEVKRLLLSFNESGDDTLLQLALEERDSNGNTPLLLALKCGYADIAYLLLDNDVAVDYLSDNQSFTVLDEALLSCRQFDIIRTIYIRMKQHVLHKFEHIINPCLKQSIPLIKDCKLKITINFINPMWNWLTSLINYFTPSETYTIWKKGDLMRIDYSIKGINSNFSVKRGRYSIFLLYNKESSGYKVLDVSWNKLKVRDLINKWHRPLELDVRLFVIKMIDKVGENKEISNFDFKTSDVVIRRSEQKSWLGNVAPNYLTETIFPSPDSNSESNSNSNSNSDGGIEDSGSSVVKGWHCELWDVKGRIQVSTHSKSQSREKGLTFREYFGYEFGEGPSESSSSSSITPALTSKNIYDKNLRSQLWVTKDIPLTISNFVDILTVVGLENKVLSDFNNILKDYEGIYSEGCVVKLVVDLISGLQASFKIDNYSDSFIEDSVFQIPSHFNFF
jgi:hypothetical protein